MDRLHLCHLIFAALLLTVALGTPLHNPREKCVWKIRKAVTACGFEINDGAHMTSLTGLRTGTRFPMTHGDIAPRFLTKLCSEECVDASVCALECATQNFGDRDMHGMAMKERAANNDLVRFMLCTRPQSILAPLNEYNGKGAWYHDESNGVWRNAIDYKGEMTRRLNEEGPSLAFNHFEIDRIGHSGQCRD